MMLHIIVTLGNCYCKHDTVWTANMLTGIKRYKEIYDEL